MRAATAGLLALLLLLPTVGAQGEGLQVAVLDTGVDAKHPELAGRVTRMSFQEGLPLPSDPLPGGVPVGEAVPDPDGRGTGVASLVAGAGLGAAPNATILDLQVVAPVASVGRATGEAASDALAWVLAQPEPPRIVLLSFNEEPAAEAQAQTLRAQVRDLWDRGVLTVVAASGTASPLDESPHVLTVAGVEGCTASVDRPGSTPKPDLVAPSSGLTVAAPTTVGGGGTTSASGTSYAAAQVAGAAAAVWSERPDLPVDALAALVRDHARGAAWDPCTGWGVLDQEATLEAARAWQPVDAGGKDTPLPLPVMVVALALAGAFTARRRM